MAKITNYYSPENNKSSNLAAATVALNPFNFNQKEGLVLPNLILLQPIICYNVPFAKNTSAFLQLRLYSSNSRKTTAMKKLYALIILLLIMGSAFSQAYRPMLSNSSEWYYSFFHLAGSGTVEYTKGGTTIISGTTYIIINPNSPFNSNSPIYLREDSLNKKNYKLDFNNNEVLEYDFNLLPGDTFFGQTFNMKLDSINYNFNDIPQQCQFDSSSCFVSPKIYYFSSLTASSYLADIWIEGVGSLYDLHSGRTNADGCANSLTCHFNDTGDKDLYFSDPFKDGDGECHALITGIETSNTNSSPITITPNPNNGESISISGKDINSITIYNIQGQHVKTVLSAYEETIINLENQPKGIYLIKAQFKNGDIVTEQLLIIR